MKKDTIESSELNWYLLILFVLIIFSLFSAAVLFLGIQSRSRYIQSQVQNQTETIMPDITNFPTASPDEEISHDLVSKIESDKNFITDFYNLLLHKNYNEAYPISSQKYSPAELAQLYDTVTDIRVISIVPLEENTYILTIILEEFGAETTYETTMTLTGEIGSRKVASTRSIIID